MKILFGVFDWGLGHATRTVPLIDELLTLGHEVHIITTGRSLDLLKKRFKKKCTFFDVPSVRAPYPHHRFFALKFSMNIPYMLLDLHRARKVSKQIIQREKYDRIMAKSAIHSSSIIRYVSICHEQSPVFLRNGLPG